MDNIDILMVNAIIMLENMKSLDSLLKQALMRSCINQQLYKNITDWLVNQKINIKICLLLQTFFSSAYS